MDYIDMKEIKEEEYKNFIKKYRYINIEGSKLEIGKNWQIYELQPKKFELETTTVWSFPERGRWATHYLNSKYRGNWAPQVPRNLILRYSNQGDTVLDAFVGSGTTLIECKLTGRNGIGVDINKDALMLAVDRLRFDSVSPDFPKSTQKLYLGDARKLNLIKDNSIDFIATHPPYANIIGYTKNSNHKEEGDLSRVRSVKEFTEEMKKVALEFYRVLKPGSCCAILMGDTRRYKHQVPISFRTMQSFLDVGFIIKEHIIKIQHKTTTAPLWKSMSIKNNFLLLMHEHLFVFRKPKKEEKLGMFNDSMKWW